MHNCYLAKEQVELQKRILFKHIRTNILKVEKSKFARALNVSITTISSIENGKSPVSHGMFISLFVLLNQYVSDKNISQGKDIIAINNIIKVIEDKYIMIDYRELF